MEDGCGNCRYPSHWYSMAVLCAIFVTMASPAADKKPNIVLVMSDGHSDSAEDTTAGRLFSHDD